MVKIFILKILFLLIWCNTIIVSEWTEIHFFIVAYPLCWGKQTYDKFSLSLPATETPSLQLPTANALRETINSTDLNEATSLILNLNFELLHSQVAYIPGSRDTRGGPVVYIDASTSCWDSISVTSEELAKLLVYYYKIPR